LPWRTAGELEVIVVKRLNRGEAVDPREQRAAACVSQAATQLEQAKIERATRDGQLGLQRGSLCIAVLSQLPRDKDELKPLFQKANELLSEILDTERARMREALKEAEELGEDDAEIDLGDEDYDELLK
jgi:hypothetical protein